MSYFEPETIGYDIPEGTCTNSEHRLLLVQQAVRENIAFIEDGEIFVDFGEDEYDDDDKTDPPKLRCVECNKTWPLVDKGKPKPDFDEACGGTGILLIDIEEWADEEDEGCTVICNRTVVQRCDECGIFDTDEDAAKALQALIYAQNK